MEVNENTPLKQKYDKTAIDYELKAAVFTNKPHENKENLPEKNKKVELQEKEMKGIKIKKQKKIKSIERSIEERENSLNISKHFLKKSSSTKNNKNKSYLGHSKPSSRNNSPNPFQINNVPEVVQLNRKIMALKKNLEDERNFLMKEKQKNRELNEEIERLNNKVKKLEIKNEKNSQLESDYVKLMESFEKSEAIRKQQKLLISNLKKESGKISKKK